MENAMLLNVAHFAADIDPLANSYLKISLDAWGRFRAMIVLGSLQPLQHNRTLRVVP